MTEPHHAENREANRYEEVFPHDDSLHSERRSEANTAREEGHVHMRADTLRLVAISTLVILVSVIIVWPAMSSSMVSKDLWESGPIWLLLLGIVLTPVVHYLYRWALHRERPEAMFLPDYVNALVAVVVFVLVFVVIVATNTAASAWMGISGNYYLDVANQNWTLANGATVFAIVIIVLSGLLAIATYLVLLWLIVRSSWVPVAIAAALVPVFLYLAIGSAMAHNAHWI